MALSSSKISNPSGFGAAAATARPLSGGRGIATQSQSEIENSIFPGYIGVTDNSILHYDDGNSSGRDGGRKRQHSDATPFITRAAAGFQVEDVANDNTVAGTVFRSELLRGIGAYEHMAQLTDRQTRPGAVINHLF